MRRTAALLTTVLMASAAALTVPAVAGATALTDPTGPIASRSIAGKCIDVAGASTNNGTPVQIYPCNGTAAQRWTVSSDGTLRALGKCMDVQGGGTADATPVQLYDCNGSGAQQWRPQGSGQVLNPQSGRCLNVWNPAGSNEQLILWDCTNAPIPNEGWNLP
jgi:hypothetical protein